MYGGRLMSDIEIEIDGKKLKAKPNAMVIQVADEAGIYIPRFCYHKHLSVAANCRMCLVEVEKSPKTLPACATPVADGMKVFTRSPKAIAAQRAVMEFLLINHPLDCPICDQGGECELQDLSMGYGSPNSYFVEGKRSVKDQDIGPLISTDMTRCIQCTRCVRFGEEVAGFRELGVVDRGEDEKITTYVPHAMQSVVSGNIIDLCPVGALTSKPFRFTARAWELQQYPSIAPHDCVGSNVYVHTRNGKVMRVVPHENKNLNLTWLSDRDRYSYEGLYHVDRLEKPLIRDGDDWQEVDWQTALEFTINGLQRVFSSFGTEQFAALASPNATVEELYLLQKLVRGVGSPHVDHRLRQVDFDDQETMPAFPGLSLPIAEIENCDVILLIGSNLQIEQPILSLRLRKAALKGAQIMALNMMDYHFHFKMAAKKIVAPHELVNAIENVATGIKSGSKKKSKGADAANQIHQIMADALNKGKKIGILLGAQALNHPNASQIREYANSIAEQTNATLGLLTEGANSAGAWLAGAVPHRGVGAKSIKAGLDAQAIWSNLLKGYLLLNVEPDVDCANPVIAINALEQAEFVVALSMFKNPVLDQYAHVMLPIAPFTETSGTFVNVSGEWQSFKGVASPLEESRPAWKVLRVLGNFMHCDGFDYKSSEEIRDEVAAAASEMASATIEAEKTNKQKKKSEKGETAEEGKAEIKLSRIGEIPIYNVDSLVRRAKALQSAQPIVEENFAVAHIHPSTAKQLEIKETDSIIVKQEESRARLPVVFDERVAENAVWIAGGIPATSGLSQLFGPIEVHKA